MSFFESRKQNKTVKSMKKNFTGKVNFWKVMKICAVQTMIAMILVGVSMAHNSSGQLLETKITLYLEDVSLEKVLKEIERMMNWGPSGWLPPMMAETTRTSARDARMEFRRGWISFFRGSVP